MSNVTQVGIDLAKNIFYLHGIDEKVLVGTLIDPFHRRHNRSTRSAV